MRKDRGVTEAPRYATAPERGIPLPRLALAMALLVAPVGLVLGVIARRRAAESDPDGARTALVAIVVGAVLTAVYVLLAVTVVVLLVLLARVGEHPVVEVPIG